MSIHAYDWAAQQNELDYSARAVLLALAAVATDEFVVRVVLPEFAESADLPARMVREIIVELEEAALLQCVRQINTGGVGSYRLLVPTFAQTGAFV